MLRMWRNVGVMLFIFALPVMQVILFCLAIGRDPQGLNLAIVNNEMNNTVRFLSLSLAASPSYYRSLSLSRCRTLASGRMAATLPIWAVAI